MKSRLIGLCLSILFGHMAFAQDTNTSQKIRGPYLTNRFNENWTIGLAGCINQYHGEDDLAGNIWKCFSPAAELSVGKWVTPIYGFRLSGTVGQLAGWSKVLSHYSVKRVDGLYYEKYNLIAGRLDFMVNLSTVFNGYNEKRRWNFIPYLGTGGAQSSGGVDKNREFTITLGVLNNIYLSPRWDFTMELRHTLVNGRFDEITTHMRLYEGFSGLSFGFAYKFGKFKKGHTAPSAWRDYSLYIRETDSLLINRQKIIAENDTLKRRMKEMEAGILPSGNCEPDTVFVVDTIRIENGHCVTSPLVVFFKINDWQLDSKGRTNLDMFVKYVIQADKYKKFRLIGSADINTGNSLINLRLSEKRVETIYNILVNEYNIPEERLIKRPEGDTNNQFPEPLLNRAVIIR